METIHSFLGCGLKHLISSARIEDNRGGEIHFWLPVTCSGNRFSQIRYLTMSRFEKEPQRSEELLYSVY